MAFLSFIRNPIAFGVACAFLVLAFTSWQVLQFVGVGLDWTDESWIIGLIADNRETLGEQWVFQHLQQPLWNLFGGTIIGGRIARFVLGQVTAAVAALALTRWAGHLGLMIDGWRVALVFAASSIGALLQWVYWLRSFGYNEFGAFLVTTSVSLAIIILVGSPKPSSCMNRFPWVLPALLGFIDAIAALNKITSGLALVGVALVLVVLMPRGSRWRTLIFGLGGFFAGVGTAWISGLPFENYVSSTIRMAFEPGYAESFAHPKWLISASILAFLSLLAEQFLYAIILTAGVVSTYSKTQVIKILGWVVILCTIASLGYLTSTQQGPLDTSARIGLNMAIIGSSAAIARFMVVARHTPTSTRVRSILVNSIVLLGAISTPFISSLGTNTPIVLNMTFNESMWGALFGIGIMVLLDPRISFGLTRWIVASVLVLASIATLQLVMVTNEQPYRDVAFKRQTESVGGETLFKDLRLSKQNADVVRWLEDIGSRHLDTPVVAVGSPASIIAFNNKPFASLWTEAFWPGSYNTISERCIEAAPKSLVVLISERFVDGSPDADLLTDALVRGCKMKFPHDFELVGISPSNQDGSRTAVWVFQN
jgi:hypothetical protein